jgi:hypothetical protein
MFQVCAELSALKSLITGLTERSCKSWGIRPAVTPGTGSLEGIIDVLAKCLRPGAAFVADNTRPGTSCADGECRKVGNPGLGAAGFVLPGSASDPGAKWRSSQAGSQETHLSRSASITCLGLPFAVSGPDVEKEGKDVKERIFIVGNDPVLLKTRRCLLADWQITSASTRDAEKAIRAGAYDLLIFSQTVSNENAKILIALASELNPLSTSLVICSLNQEDRNFGSATYRVDLTNPGGLRAAVAKLLDSRLNTEALRP